MNEQDAEFIQQRIKDLVAKREARLNELPIEQQETDFRLKVIEAQINEYQYILDTFDDWFEM